MGVQITDHAADGAFEQLRIIQRFDIVALHAIKHLGEQARLFPCQLFRRGRLAVADQPTAYGQAQSQYETDDNDQNCTNFQ